MACFIIFPFDGSDRLLARQDLDELRLDPKPFLREVLRSKGRDRSNVVIQRVGQHLREKLAPWHGQRHCFLVLGAKNG